jgi:ABC-type multidrug transport system fused ATPase/permease subunit
MVYGAVFVGQSAIYTSDYQKAKIAAANIFKLIDRKPLKSMDSIPLPQNTSECNGNIEFRGIHFNYPNRPEAEVLKGFSFSASKGETIALVGQSGCGKSTSIQLIEKFYDCTKGKIVCLEFQSFST